MDPTERLEGELIAFSFRAADGGFAVARLRPEGGGETTVVGPIGHVNEGQHVQLEGRWMTHPTFGRQFKVSRFLVEDPRTAMGLTRYLSSGAVRGLGPKFAAAVVEHFGLDTIRVIEEQPERLLEVKGIGRKRLEEITSHWRRDQENRELYVTLAGYGIGAGQVARIVEHFGADALAVVTRTPYRLAAEVKGIGFRSADAIAQSMGMSADDPARAEAALQYLLGEAEDEGHCFLPEAELLSRGSALNLGADVLAPALDRLVSRGATARWPSADPARRPVYLARMDRMESRVAARLSQLVHGFERGPGTGAEVEAALGLTLNADQRRAVELALSSSLAVITGGPGTGKTTIVRVLIARAERRNERWLLCAPTGRAARRLAEATGQEARTLHRLLEYSVRLGRFTRNHDNPLDADGVLVDEASMLDLALFDALLAAIKRGTKLVLVGDADQLPSVGPGRVLGDIIDSGVLPVASLTEVYRQARDSGIVRNAHRVNQGILPVSSEREPEPGPLQDFYLLERDDPDEVLHTVQRVLQERLPRRGLDPLTEVQVLTPLHGGPLGTEALNQRIQDDLNPRRAAPEESAFTSDRGVEVSRAGRRLRVGDRVIQVKNNYDLDVFNGDVGVIVGLDDASLEVDFDGRRLALVGEQLRDVELAWAISIHKSQGSEYPAVVVVLSRSHRIMLRRNLLYTAITRARRFCCVIGDRWALEQATRTRGGDERWTRLAERLVELAGDPG